ncbi:hypothetical protein H9Q10_03935 [Eikenella sp. S3360]|uniref:Apea-like HEPN domain-containing protein n=1 Tax=Eikenella glucosivorans TaxID=2766967 RepID=A0ABS0N961_9NEIS|nr:HEPN domain-containing protein [Eikenella glucosivorans]MBH5328816.1 hypothetical protein [Eikenella glucosivorans]
MSINLSTIQTHYHQHRDTYSDPFRLRIHRALSWLDKAEELLSGKDTANHAKQPAIPKHMQQMLAQQGGRLSFAPDWDTGFQALWIAFNAAYAREIDEREISGDRSHFRQFLNTICRLDEEKLIYALVWQTFPGAIRSLLGNRYVFQPFGDFHNGKISEIAWQEEFEKAGKKAQRALAAQDTDTVLLIMFDRLYTLRNQIIHGGATYGSSANRNQLKDACRILISLLPLVLHIMQQHPDYAWGKPYYPFVKED